LARESATHFSLALLSEIISKEVVSEKKREKNILTFYRMLEC
jgi:hypothetical protein